MGSRAFFSASSTVELHATRAGSARQQQRRTSTIVAKDESYGHVRSARRVACALGRRMRAFAPPRRYWRDPPSNSCANSSTHSCRGAARSSPCRGAQAFRRLDFKVQATSWHRVASTTRRDISSRHRHARSRQSSIERSHAGIHKKGIYNLDDTDYFYCRWATRTHAKTTCAGTKQSNKRITVTVTSNADGSARVPLVFVATAQQPRF